MAHYWAILYHLCSSKNTLLNFGLRIKRFRKHRSIYVYCGCLHGGAGTIISQCLLPFGFSCNLDVISGRKSLRADHCAQTRRHDRYIATRYRVLYVVGVTRHYTRSLSALYYYYYVIYRDYIDPHWSDMHQGTSYRGDKRAKYRTPWDGLYTSKIIRSARLFAQYIVLSYCGGTWYALLCGPLLIITLRAMKLSRESSIVKRHIVLYPIPRLSSV